MNSHLKFKAMLAGFGILKIAQVILQLWVMSFIISVQSRYKHILEFNVVILILFILTIALDYINYKKNHSFFYGEVIFFVIALIAYAHLVILLFAFKPVNIQGRRHASDNISITQNSNEPTIYMNARFTNINMDLFYKIILPLTLIILLQITNFFLSLIIIDGKLSIQKNALAININNTPTTVHGNHANSEIGISYINNEILTNVNRTKVEVLDSPPPTYDEVVSQVPETVISLTPPPTYKEARKMRKINLKDSSLKEENTEMNDFK